jgi:hypothetical protein
MSEQSILHKLSPQTHPQKQAKPKSQTSSNPSNALSNKSHNKSHNKSQNKSSIIQPDKQQIKKLVNQPVLIAKTFPPTKSIISTLPDPTDQSKLPINIKRTKIDELSRANANLTMRVINLENELIQLQQTVSILQAALQPTHEE